MFLSLHIFRGHSAREPASAVCNDEVIMIMVVVVVVVVMIKMMVVVMKKRMVMMMNLSESASLHIICNEIYCAALSQSIACSHRQHPSAGEREERKKIAFHHRDSVQFSPLTDSVVGGTWWKIWRRFSPRIFVFFFCPPKQ